MPAPFHYIERENFVLNEYGDYFYNECFEKTDIDFFAKQKYKKIIPYTIIKFYDFYLMNTKEERNIWYRGRKDANGNLEYDCYMESLKVIPWEKASRGKNLLDFPM